MLPYISGMKNIFSLDNAVRLMTCVYASVVIWVMAACVHKYMFDEPVDIIIRETEKTIQQ